MQVTDLDQAAELTIWPRATPARTARSQEYATLREALVAAGKVIVAGEARAWIITADGEILPPKWIEARVAAGRV